MPTKKERIALAKAKEAKNQAEVKKIQAKILAKQLAEKKASKAKGKEKVSNIRKSIQNTSAKQSRDKADREIAYNKSVAKVKDINKKAGRTLKNDSKTNAQTVRSQNTMLGIPNDFSPKNKDTSKNNETKTEKSTTAKKSTPRKKVATASSFTEAKIKKLNPTPVKGENVKAKLERELSESDQQKLAKLQKMKDRADKKQNRKDKSIERLAFRMGDKATFQDAAALKQKRGEARKQYLRNFASQLARGEQAAPIKGFGEGEDGKPTTGSSLTDIGTQKENKAKKEQEVQDQKSIQASINTFGTPNSGLGLGVTSMGGVGEQLASIDIMGQTEVPDLTPITYMQKEYRKKRGGY